MKADTEWDSISAKVKGEELGYKNMRVGTGDLSTSCYGTDCLYLSCYGTDCLYLSCYGTDCLYLSCYGTDCLYLSCYGTDCLYLSCYGTDCLYLSCGPNLGPAACSIARIVSRIADTTCCSALACLCSPITALCQPLTLLHFHATHTALLPARLCE